MADDEIRVEPGGAPTPAPASTTGEHGLGELLRELADDSAALLKQEVELAKAEMRENVRAVARDAAMVAAGGAVALVGALVLVAFLVLLLGDVLADEYWLGALIVGAVLLAIGGLLAWTNLKSLRRDDLKPDRTIETLKEDKQWVQSEIRQAKRELS